MDVGSKGERETSRRCSDLQNGLRHNKLSSSARSSSSRSRHQQLIVRAQNQSSSAFTLCYLMLNTILKERKKPTCKLIICSPNAEIGSAAKSDESSYWLTAAIISHVSETLFPKENPIICSDALEIGLAIWWENSRNELQPLRSSPFLSKMLFRNSFQVNINILSRVS